MMIARTDRTQSYLQVVIRSYDLNGSIDTERVRHREPPSPAVVKGGGGGLDRVVGSGMKVGRRDLKVEDLRVR